MNVKSSKDPGMSEMSLRRAIGSASILPSAGLIFVVETARKRDASECEQDAMAWRSSPRQWKKFYFLRHLPEEPPANYGALSSGKPLFSIWATSCGTKLPRGNMTEEKGSLSKQITRDHRLLVAKVRNPPFMKM